LKHILITGGAGYIGSHINKLLCEKGYSTVVLDNLVYGHKEAVKWGYFEKVDLNDIEGIKAVFGKYDISTVFHFAAYAYVGESVEAPAKYYRNNVINTINLLDVMLEHNVKQIIFSSSCATYGTPEQVPIKENAVQNPINPYGRTKYMMEQVLSDYGKAYGIKHCNLRYFNAAGADPDGEIGESHTPETHIIPLVLDAAKNGSTVNVFGTDYPTRDGSCIRDYIHVSDLAQAHVQAMEYLVNGGNSTSINLGNGTGTSVLELIDTARKVTGKEILTNISDRRDGDPPELIGSSELATEILGWKPMYNDIETIIRHAWKWFKRPDRY